MRRRSQGPEEMPMFKSYDTPQAPEVEESVDFLDTTGSGWSPNNGEPIHVSAPESLRLLKAEILAAQEQEDRRNYQLYERVLFPTQPRSLGGAPARPMIGARPTDPRQIEANYRQAIAAAPAGRQPLREPENRTGVPQPNGPTTVADLLEKDKAETSRLRTFLTENKNTSRVVLAGGMIVAIALMGYGNRGESGEATAAALSAQSLSKEQKNDTFASNTVLAISSPTTLPGAEVRVPVELKEAGREAYVSIQLKRIKLGDIAVKANPTLVNGTDKAIWGRLVDDKFAIDRSAIDLTVEPWIKRVAASENQASSAVGTQLLPSAMGLPLFVEGKQVDYKKYPLSDKGSQQLASIVEVKDPKKPVPMFSNNFMNALVAKIEFATVEALENPSQCTTLSQAVDSANLANFSIQKSIDLKRLAIVEKTAYGKASDGFKVNPVVKAGVDSKAFSLHNFNISCDAKPVLPNNEATPKTSPTTTAPAPGVKK